MLADELVVDEFVTTDPSVLREALAPIVRELRAREHIELRAVDDYSLPFGIAPKHTERELTAEAEAEQFLTA